MMVATDCARDAHAGVLARPIDRMPASRRSADGDPARPGERQITPRRGARGDGTIWAARVCGRRRISCAAGRTRADRRLDLGATIAAALVGGLVADGIIAAVRPDNERALGYRVMAGLAPLTLWTGYSVILRFVHTIVWPFDLCLGTTLLAALSGILLGYVAIAPHLPSSITEREHVRIDIRTETSTAVVYDAGGESTVSSGS
jgi:hypothetical protein